MNDNEKLAFGNNLFPIFLWGYMTDDLTQLKYPHKWMGESVMVSSASIIIMAELWNITIYGNQL